MKKNSNIILLLFTSMLTIILIITCFVFYLYQIVQNNTPQLSDLAKKSGKPAFAITYNYPKSFNQQLYHFSKNMGLVETNSKQTLPPTSNVGSTGFFILDIKPQNSKRMIKKLDEVLSDFLNFIDEETTEEHEFFDPRNYGYIPEESKFFPTQDSQNLIANELELSQNEESPFSKPLSFLIEELWNGQTFLFGGATQLQLSTKNIVLLSLAPYLKKDGSLSPNSFEEIFVKSIPKNLENYLKKHSLNISFNTLKKDDLKDIKHSQLTLSVTDPSEFLNSICSIKINPWDYCGRFSLQRDKFRKNFEAILSLLSNDFKLNLNIYWTLKGKTLIYSNQLSYIENLTSLNVKEEANNIITSVSASGNDFLLPSDSPKTFTSFSILFDMIKIQNELIDFSERIRQNSNILSDYFSSPAGEVYFSDFENKVNKLTGYSEKASITLDTDGNKIIPELRLFSPTGDLFQKNGKELSPEVIGSIRSFITKTISLGNYLQPKELLPLPGPFIQKNGKWIIISSEILAKLIPSYLEHKNPYIDKYYDPTNL
ncbi:hypothetical protein [Fluviispira multicolorata]|uniref:Uncharacterized protein n=1 Tax=Fluviispira multicolorata TaxID=2654512 RepID=A0A833N4E6_9BACT|nr:hypothetical protein [Fluviispira multicolorata]KAB8030756.1 hypothetical protein GCL57_07220 [Fluviispira multicolorata]